MTRSTLISTCTRLAAVATLFVTGHAHAQAPAPASPPAPAAAPAPAPDPAAPAPAPAPEGPASVELATSASTAGQPAADGGAPQRCQDRRDVKWIRRCLPQRMTWELGIYGGVFFPAANSHELFNAQAQLDSGDTFWRPYRTIAPAIGLRVAFFPFAFLGGEVEGGVMPTRVVEAGGPGDRATLFTFRAHVIGQLPFWRVTPFILVGSGGLGTTGRLGNDFDPMTHFGGGIKVFLTQRALLRLDIRDNVAARKVVDAGATNYPEVLLGLSAVLGRKKPAKEPDTDSDGDGFLDKSDACPYEPGISPDGCPERDRDGDGFMDSKDRCPDVPGIAPDGCPEGDRDGDGFLDSVDKCPDVPGVAPDGCPDQDRDKDGILDNVDKCPDIPENYNGFEDKDGCPDKIPDPVTADFTGTIKGIYFDLDKDTIKPKSRPVLDRAVKVLSDYDSIRIEISGHTDSTGSVEHNRDLSRRRAESVKRYLVQGGIAESRITTRGAGPDEPVDTNRTAAGRAKNRRIEFLILIDKKP